LAQVSAVPIHAVVGAPGSGKSALIARHAAEDPDLLGFVNVRVQELPNLVVAPAGCPCCTARVAMRVALTRLLRERRPVRVYVELPDAAHAEQLARVLGEWPLSRYVAPAPAISLS
jgi:hypothetical protein